MSSLSIRAKLLSVIALFSVGFVVYLSVVWAKTAEKVEDSDYAGVIDDKDFVADILPPPMFVLEAYSSAFELATISDKAVADKAKAAIDGFKKDFETRRQYWNEHLHAAELVDEVNGPLAKTAAAVFDVIDHEVIAAIERGDRAAALGAMPKLNVAYVAHRAIVDDLVQKSDLESKARIEHAAAAIHNRKLELALFGSVIMLLAASIGFITARNVSRRLANTAIVLDHVADGDYTQRMVVDSGDEVGAMATNLNRALAAIDRAFGEVRSVAAAMSASASGLAASSEQISSGAQEQAASLEETAASLEEITATVKQSAGNAHQASQLATSSRQTAEAGGNVVGQAVTAMNEVIQSSRKIGDIITTIDEIALQTNLLALNAAVEAARAGEQGRGFAVVASEVGNLAQRSATAAKEVKVLIEDTLSRVHTGHRLVGESGRALSEIIVSVKKVTDIFSEIAAAAREQSAGVDQVNEAVAQMDRVTQSNSAQTAELSQTAEGLAGQANQLDDLLAKFQLSEEPDRAPSEPDEASGSAAFVLPATTPSRARQLHV